MDIQNIISGKKYAKIVFSIIMVLSLEMTAIYIINYIDKCSAIQEDMLFQVVLDIQPILQLVPQ